MKYTALIGNPTQHSVSHILYEELLEAAGISIPYKHIKIDIKSKDLDKSYEAFNTLNFSGLSVTLPHKLAIIPLLDEIDGVVIELGAVNTVKLGEINTGYNTDWLGLYKPLAELSGKYNIVSVLGTGGAARAAIYTAKKLGANKIFVHYRSNNLSENTVDLMNKAHEYGIVLRDYSLIKESIEESSLVINATSAGMVGKVDLPFELEKIYDLDLSKKILFDAVFNPIKTKLIKYFTSKGAKTIDGLWMMIYQGVAALEIWTEEKIVVGENEIKKIHKMLSEELRNV